MENKKGAEGLSGFVPLVLFRFCVPGAAALQEKQSDQKSSQQAHYGGKYLFSAGGSYGSVRGAVLRIFPAVRSTCGFLSRAARSSGTVLI